MSIWVVNGAVPTNGNIAPLQLGGKRLPIVHVLGSDMLFDSQQFLEPGIVADRGPDGIDFQARDGNGFACGDQEKLFQILNCLGSSTGLRLNLGQTGQIAGTKHRVLSGGNNSSACRAILIASSLRLRAR